MLDAADNRRVTARIAYALNLDESPGFRPGWIYRLDVNRGFVLNKKVSLRKGSPSPHRATVRVKYQCTR